MTIHAQGLREHEHHQVPSAEDSAGQANQILTLLDSEWDSSFPWAALQSKLMHAPVPSCLFAWN